jgi:dihydroneopterin aldolase
MKDGSESYACIFVQEMIVKIRIGLHASEAKPQRVAVNVRLYTDPKAYLGSVDEASIINYQRIHSAVMEWQGRPHVKLVETYVRELLDLAFGFEKVAAAKVSVSKLDIFREAQGAGVEIFMTHADYKKLK